MEASRIYVVASPTRRPSIEHLISAPDEFELLPGRLQPITTDLRQSF